MVGGLFGYMGVSGSALDNQVISFSNSENYADITVATNTETTVPGSANIGGITTEVYFANASKKVEVTSVTNSGDIIVTGKYADNWPHVAGFIPTLNATTTTLTSCVNEGDITVETTGTKLPRIGGIVADDTNKGSLTITSCENKGTITNKGIVTSGIRIGGIHASRDNNTNPTTITNCVNSGKIVLEGEQTASGNAWAIGGIFGYTNKAGLTLDGCVNGVENGKNGEGNVTLGTAPGTSGVAGIAGYLSQAATIKNCKNYGTIKQEGNSGTCQFGGIVGYQTAYACSLESCENAGIVTNTGEVATALYLGGLIGHHAPGSALTIKNSKNSGSVLNTGVAPTPILGGAVALVTASNATIETFDNSGTVKNEAVVTTSVLLGGAVGHFLPAKTLTITGSKNSGSVILAGTQTAGAKNSLRYCIGGLVGKVEVVGATVSVSDSHNGVLDETTKKPVEGKGVITVSNTPSQNATGGIIAHSMGVTTISGCNNYGTISRTGTAAQCGFGDGQNNGTYLGGILGVAYMSGGGATITDCENYGVVDITVGCFKNRPEIGGICGRLYSGSITGCKNLGTVSLKTTATGHADAETSVGGIVGTLTDGKAENCESSKDAKVSCATTVGNNVNVGGLVGSANNVAAQVLYCKNKGAVEQPSSSKGTTQFGGVVGYGYSFKQIAYSENHGPINAVGTAGQFSVGGIVGFARYQIAQEDGFVSVNDNVNTGKITVNSAVESCTYFMIGGVMGYCRMDKANTDHVTSNLWNLGEIEIANVPELTADVKKPRIGGVVAFVRNGDTCTIDNSYCYGTITAFDQTGYTGMIMGMERTDKVKATNCQVGGKLVTSLSEPVVDEESGESSGGGEELPGNITTSNWYKHIYATEVTEAVATSDGCSLLESKPAVPTYTYTPAN